MKFENAVISEKIHPDLISMLRKAPQTMSDALGMELIKLDPAEVVASMPVDHRTVQPVGLLHGGASVALAETLCSIGAWLQLDPNTHTAVGVEINANHIRAVRSGKVVGRATPMHVGRQIQVWECRIETEDGKIVCTSRCTLMAVARR